MLALFAATTFLSALLLFSVQPLFAKMVLPVLGGSPSVWAVALLFFQAALLVGYGYAHMLIALGAGGVDRLRASRRMPAGPHRAADRVAGRLGASRRRASPISGSSACSPLPSGLPFVAVAANAPLLQAWFARTGHPHAQDPYFLYGASNLGSLIALLGYPFVLEPAFGLTALSRYWAVALRGADRRARRLLCAGAPARDGAMPTAAEDAGRSGPLGRTDVARPHRLGAGLALVPAALLTAFTTHVATDIASAPLLWVLPLALYLLDLRARLPVAPAAADVRCCCRRSSPRSSSRCSSWRRPSTTSGC